VEPAFRTNYAKTLKRHRLQPGGKWLLDEEFARLRGKLHYLCGLLIIGRAGI
jgi:putative transposase